MSFTQRQNNTLSVSLKFKNSTFQKFGNRRIKFNKAKKEHVHFFEQKNNSITINNKDVMLTAQI